MGTIDILKPMIAGMLLILPAGYASGIFSTSNRVILLNGSDFEVRGMCYQPTPIGENAAGAPPYGDYFTVGYSNLWARDFPNLRMMGANVIRHYGWTIGADHTAFLDAAYNGGDQSLYVLVSRWIDPATDWSDSSAVDAWVAEWEAIATELKDHPAVMGFLIGNEINGLNNNGSKPDFWAAMNRIAGAVKAIAPNKLVSVPLWDIMSHVQTWDATMTNIDFWAMQVYRGHTFGSFFTDYASHSTKPLVFTEFGYDAFDARTSEEFENDAELPADAMEYLWNEIRMNRSVVSGGCVFEYADEWWKIFAANPSVHDTDGWSSGDRFVDGEGNEEWWGVFRILDNGSNPDLLEPRAMFFRLAGMWNDAYESSISEVHLTNGNFMAQFSHPAHLRDQHIELEMSTNLTDWIAAGGNYRTNTLTAYAPSVGFSGTETNDDMVVNFIHEPASTGTYDPPNLVHYGHFEPGTTMGWTTWCPAVNTFSRDGAYSLEFTGTGGWSVPQAFQTVPAKPGEEYHLSGYMYTPALLPADATSGIVKIVFRDEFGTDLPPASITIGGPSGDPNYPGAESRPALNASSPVHFWVYSEAQAVAPPNTVSVSFYALNLDQSAATMYFDSIEAAKVIQMPNDDDGAFFRVINYGL